MESSIAYEITIKYGVKLTKLKCIFEDLGFLKVLLRELPYSTVLNACGSSTLRFGQCTVLIDDENKEYLARELRDSSKDFIVCFDSESI